MGKKQRRRKNGRISTPQNNLTEEQALRHLLHISSEDVNLQFIFNHIINYTVCGGMLFAGTKVVTLNTAETTWWDWILNLLAWGVLFALPWLLFALNFAHGLFAVFSLQNSRQIRMWIYLPASLIIFITAGKFMLTFVAG